MRADHVSGKLKDAVRGRVMALAVESVSLDVLKAAGPKALKFQTEKKTQQ